jgi:sRNA-binding protein
MTRQDDYNEFIHLLCKQYPKCFFDEPRMRRPLKQNIVADIKNDKDFDVTPEKIQPAVDWYMSHVGYDYATVAGAKRIDLDGNAAGTVTEPEALAALQRLDEFRKKKAEVTNPVRTLIDDYGVIRKLETPPMLHRSKAAAIAPEFATLYETLTAANAAVTGISDPAMRAVVAKTLLDMVINKAEHVRTELTQV